ncbi:7,8-didemethyl-8-hydroxy-5-deazariboflavin synthase CofG [Salisediminibacterium selenitireducens]|uniref:7,8-didemethyl-8-hydroxy-5-deazariboflavin synthase n=1 Tax=Bacillus selenitireducens (strain ATCC 700615 / DSM 15326 / MLS10) TaxID=439292 RepID=D6XU84_BACIE|nr:7,8-didemethyl-8-hydroxy-5-deazariboflavin synthase CofG [Salisediminibacterium selenitireducens]ADH99370.1 7,8-didemethyl-8-hydroxy-5-deazariboflavin synthase, CofG subunit [[Bacillus] selenitireducens MLS10]
MNQTHSYWLHKATQTPLPKLMSEAFETKKQYFASTITYSKNIFIPLTNICKDRCSYCTFQRRPGDEGAEIIPEEEVMKQVYEAKRAGCTEILITMGDKSDYFPEVRAWLNERGFRNIIEYTIHICKRIVTETGLLPHTNAGVLTNHQLKNLKPYNPSMGMMLETTSERLMMPGEVHEHAPDKWPHRRIRMIEEAGKLKIPFTTGLLVGIGETWAERVDTLLEIKRINDQYGHIQEVIIQNFQPKDGMDHLIDNKVGEDTMLRLCALANLMYQGEMHIQVPPNLNRDYLRKLIDAGITDFGGVSPLTLDYINPEAPWPAIDRLREITAEKGQTLQERLPVYNKYFRPEWISEPAWSAVQNLKGREQLETIAPNA